MSMSVCVCIINLFLTAPYSLCPFASLSALPGIRLYPAKPSKCGIKRQHPCNRAKEKIKEAE